MASDAAFLTRGLVQLRSGRILFGEYFRNDSRVPVRVYASDDDAQSWRVLHKFPAGRIRHIHALIEDPYRVGVWLCTGDLDDESFLAHSSNGGDQFDIVGGGSAGTVARLLRPLHARVRVLGR